MIEHKLYLGRPAIILREAGEGERVLVTAAPGKDGEARQEGTLRLIRFRDGAYVAARFLDGLPKRKET